MLAHIILSSAFFAPNFKCRHTLFQGSAFFDTKFEMQSHIISFGFLQVPKRPWVDYRQVDPELFTGTENSETDSHDRTVVESDHEMSDESGQEILPEASDEYDSNEEVHNEETNHVIMIC